MIPFKNKCEYVIHQNPWFSQTSQWRFIQDVSQCWENQNYDYMDELIKKYDEIKLDTLGSDILSTVRFNMKYSKCESVICSHLDIYSQ